VRARAALPVAALAGAALLACGALAGCSAAAAGQSSPAGQASPAAGGTLCASIGRIDSLVVSRANDLPQNHETFTFPATITVSGIRPARAAARAVCELPDMPSGTFHCPNDLGITYQLTFSAGDRKFAPVTLDATGCQSVSGLSPGRWTARSPGFWHTLAVAAGITPADQATFRGSTAS
jgi:hypothetical protein